MSEQSLTDAGPDEEGREVSLADATPEPDDDGDDLDELIEDATEDMAEDDFDFGAFVDGVRPTRRAVVLYQHNDVRAEVDILSEKVRVGKMAGEDVSEYETLLQQAAEHVLSSGRKVIVEARGSDWQQQFRKDMKARGIDPYAKKFRADQLEKLPEAKREKRLAEHRDQLSAYVNHMIAAQIVHPTTGVDADAIARLAANSEQEVEKLHRAVQDANRQPGVSVDFLRAHSGTRRPGLR